MSTLWFFEDNQAKIRQMEDLLSDNDSPLRLHICVSLPEALSVIDNIQDEDWVTIDSQMPDQSGESNDVYAGLRLASEIRARGKKVRVFWHSDSYDCKELLNRLAVEPRPYDQILMAADSAQLPIPGDASIAANLLLDTLKDEPFEPLAPLMVFLQGCLFGYSERSRTEDMIVRDLLWGGASETAELNEIRNSEDFIRWQIEEWRGWFESPLASLQEIIGTMERVFRERFLYYFLDFGSLKYKIEWFLSQGNRRRSFQELSLLTSDPYRLHELCLEAVMSTLGYLCNEPLSLSEMTLARCYGALQILGLCRAADSDNLLSELRRCRHDLENCFTPLGLAGAVEQFQSVKQSDIKGAQDRLGRLSGCYIATQRSISRIAQFYNPLERSYILLSSRLPQGTREWLFPLSRQCVSGWLQQARWEKSARSAIESFEQTLFASRSGGSGDQPLKSFGNMMEVLRVY